VDDRVQIFGIRHHGPGSASSLRKALDHLKPDCILIEGPADADSLIPMVGDRAMKPPVAILVYAADRPRLAGFYPFAEFSPEWRALKYAHDNKVDCRFIDFPQSHQLALNAQREDEDDSPGLQPDKNDPEPETAENTPDSADPLNWLARAAGYDDGEEWWDHAVEQRMAGADVFGAIREAMTTIRAEFPGKMSEAEAQRQQRREAYMRKCIRQALKAGHERIAVVCGAWHVSALSANVKVKDDNALLKGLPKVKVQATWVPWTYDRLAFSSGYGAGVVSPGWYHHLWTHRYARRGGCDPRALSINWLVKVSRLFRDQGLDISSAHLIEAIRLTETLAALRNKPLPGLDEINEAVQTVLCFGDETPLKLVHSKLVVGQRMGEIPERTPEVPLQKDLGRLQKSLRLKPEAVEKVLDLDLRKPNGLKRSHLLHRLNLLNIPWGQLADVGGSKKGTFHEIWALQWKPEFAIQVIEASIWGNTIESAASNSACAKAKKAGELAEIASIIDSVILGDLNDAVAIVAGELNDRAAKSNDVTELMAAVAPLANVLRYGDVRGTDSSMISEFFDRLVVRICIGLGNAASSLDQDGALRMLQLIVSVDEAMVLLQNEAHLDMWRRCLEGMTQRDDVHALISGRLHRILLDASVYTGELLSSRMSYALSSANDPALAAAWLEGFLGDSAMVLLYDERIWAVMDQWLCELNPERFTEVLPLVRRTFSNFSQPERSQLGGRVRRGKARAAKHRAEVGADIDRQRAATVIPLLRGLLGLNDAD